MPRLMWNRWTSRLCGSVLLVIGAGAAEPADERSLFRVPGSPPAGASESVTAADVLLGPEDHQLRRLFTPESLPRGTFRVHRSPEPIERLAVQLGSLDPTPAPGAWHLERADVWDAFGTVGPYDRGRLARLFAGRRAWVARGSLRTPGGRLAYTLISPYPDPSFSTLNDGTMVIVTKLPI